MDSGASASAIFVPYDANRPEMDDADYAQMVAAGEINNDEAFPDRKICQKPNRKICTVSSSCRRAFLSHRWCSTILYVLSATRPVLVHHRPHHRPHQRPHQRPHHRPHQRPHHHRHRPTRRLHLLRRHHHHLHHLHHLSFKFHLLKRRRKTKKKRMSGQVHSSHGLDRKMGMTKMSRRPQP